MKIYGMFRTDARAVAIHARLLMDVVEGEDGRMRLCVCVCVDVHSINGSDQGNRIALHIVQHRGSPALTVYPHSLALPLSAAIH